MTDRETRIVTIWTLAGLAIGLATTPFYSGDELRALWCGLFGTGLGLLLVLRLRWRR